MMPSGEWFIFFSSCCALFVDCDCFCRNPSCQPSNCPEECDEEIPLNNNNATSSNNQESPKRSLPANDEEKLVFLCLTCLFISVAHVQCVSRFL